MDSTPRHPDWLKADLKALHHKRADAQADLIRCLNAIDAIDGKIQARVDELSRALQARQRPVV